MKNLAGIGTADTETFCSVSIFREIREDQNAIKILSELFTIQTFPSGSEVIKEGEYGDSLFIIKTGTVAIIRKTRHGDPYTVTELNADMNAFFGEVALIDHEKRSATVRCTTDCSFYVLTRDKFLELGNNYPVIGLAITRELAAIICQKLRRANDDVVILFDALVDEVAQSGGLNL